MSQLTKDLRHVTRVGYNAVNDRGIHAKAADRIEELESLLAEMNDYLNTNHLTSISARSIFHQ